MCGLLFDGIIGRWLWNTSEEANKNLSLELHNIAFLRGPRKLVILSLI